MRLRKGKAGTPSRTPALTYSTTRRLPAPSIRPAAPASAATVAPFRTAARLPPVAAPVSVPAATDRTVTVPSTSRAEVTASLVTASPLPTVGVRLNGIGAARTDSAQRGGHERSTGELYRPTPRDGAGIQTRRQIVEGAIDPFFSPHQHRNSSLPQWQNSSALPLCTTAIV
jgi:hypothetical protein